MFDNMAWTACPFALAISSGVCAGAVAAAAGAGGGVAPVGAASGTQVLTGSECVDARKSKILGGPCFALESKNLPDAQCHKGG